MPDMIDITLYVSLGAAIIGLALTAVGGERYEGVSALLGLVFGVGAAIVVYNYSGGSVALGIGSFVAAGGGYFMVVQRQINGNL